MNRRHYPYLGYNKNDQYPKLATHNSTKYYKSLKYTNGVTCG